MAEQQAPPEAEPTAVDDEPEAEAIDVAEAAAEADVAEGEPAAEADAAEEEPTAEADADASAESDDDGDDVPARDPDDQAAVDDVTAHSTRVVDPDAEGPVTSGMRTPPGIPAGLDPGTLGDRDPGSQKA